MRARLACLLSLSTHCRQVPYLFKASFILGIYQSENRRRIYKSYRRMRPPTSYFENTVDRNMENMFSISFRKHHDGKEENNLFTLIIKIEVLFARAIIMSTACASSVSVET